MFVLFGIILFILLNSNDGFSVGVPEYLLTIDNTDINIALSNYSHDEEAWAINEDGPLSPSNPVIMVDENRYYVYGDDSVDGINDANRNYATYVASMQSMAGGSTDSGGGACAPVDKSELIVLNDRCINSPPNVGTQEHLESLPWSDGTNRCNWYENGMRHDGSSPRCEQYGRIGANEKWLYMWWRMCRFATQSGHSRIH